MRSHPSLRAILFFLAVIVIVAADFVRAQAISDDLVQNSPNATRNVTITEQGFDPAQVTIAIGDTVTWTNTTQRQITLKQSNLWQLYLPMTGRGEDVLQGQSALQTYRLFLPYSARTTEGSDENGQSSDGIIHPTIVGNTNSGLFEQTLSPGGSYSHTFSTVGNFPVFVPDNLAMSGQIRVIENGPTSTPTATPTSTPSPTATVTSTSGSGDTPTATNTSSPTVTPTVTSTNTTTATPSNTPTKTATNTPTATSTTTPTGTATTSPTPLNTPTATATATAEPVTGARLPVINVPAGISANTTFTNGAVYLISGLTTVYAGVTLQIEPGATIKFQSSNNSSGRLLVNGALQAIGTANSRIVFTSVGDDRFGGDTLMDGGGNWPRPGDWSGLEINGNSKLNRVVIAYAGSGGSALTVSGTEAELNNGIVEWSAGDGLRWTNNASGLIEGNRVHHNLGVGLRLTNSSAPTIRSNTFASNRISAIYLEANGFPVVEGNTAYDNGMNGINVNGTVGTGKWYPNLPYMPQADLVVETGNTLTLLPGVVVKFSSSQDFIVRGALSAGGTLSDPVVFTDRKSVV